MTVIGSKPFKPIFLKKIQKVWFLAGFSSKIAFFQEKIRKTETLAFSKSIKLKLFM